ncbi:hypothetical protein [Methylobacterium sp. Leaf106]|uniref:hypothetical protein n=1 Tax=Methylobacterium sp. Leaf106 TaxID=1736255 RepID=UPI0006FD6025|nr:hypothetical protein [Methylobacterium sp. Leaf106]KQP50607.1 hypothetical protein ASF34_19930 [Methylobacterium sp. Leaf106]
MGHFTDEMRARLPAGFTLPPEIASLFDWIEERGLLHESQRVPGDRFGTLQPLEPPYRGAVVLFRVEREDEARSYAEGWFGNPDTAARLIPFARTGADGSYAAFWLDDEGCQRIVHLGSEGDGLCVLGQTPLDFLRLLAIGHNELGIGLAHPDAEPEDEPDYEMEVDNPPFRDWLTTTYGVTIPRTVSEIVPAPPDSFAKASDDPFWQWVRRLQDIRDGAVPPGP